MKPGSIKDIQSRVGSQSMYEFVAPSHTSDMFNPVEFRKVVRKTVKKVLALRKLYPEIEALAACGQSGLMLMGAVSLLTGLPQIAVRKTQDSEYDSSLANGWFGCKGYLVLDDLVDSGETLERIASHINKSTLERWQSGYSRPKLIAALLYRRNYNNAAEFVVDGARATANFYGVNAPNFELEASWKFKSGKLYRLEDEERRGSPGSRRGSGRSRAVGDDRGLSVTFSAPKAQKDPAPGRLLDAADVAESFNALRYSPLLEIKYSLIDLDLPPADMEAKKLADEIDFDLSAQTT